MTSTFYLKDAKSKTPTLIYFSCRFKEENKKFVYYTGEKILPEHWNQNNKRPVASGPKKAIDRGVIKMQLDRYDACFVETKSRCKTFQEPFTSQVLREEFDKEFKRVAFRNTFFEVYDEFMSDKIKKQEWKESTAKRYRNIRNILKAFEKDTKCTLSFNNINNKFHANFTDYCMNKKDHVNNTYARNLGLFKTFMHWALDNGYTYTEEFKKFRKVEKVITQQIALKKDDLQKLMSQNFEHKYLERVRDVFVFSCITGLRFGELKFISKANIDDGYLHLKEEKGAEKESRTIPLNDLAYYLLRKYDYNLPLISNQRQNEYVKEVFRIAGYTWEVQRNVTKGKEVVRDIMPFYERISTHTARRTFITMLKSDGKSDKLISKITGHRDIKTMNQYYQVDDEAKKEAVASTFNIDFNTLKKAE